MVRLRLLSTSSVVETAKSVVATTFRSAVNVKAEPESERLTEKVGRQTQELCKLLTEETKALGSSLIFAAIQEVVLRRQQRDELLLTATDAARVSAVAKAAIEAMGSGTLTYTAVESATDSTAQRLKTTTGNRVTTFVTAEWLLKLEAMVKSLRCMQRLHVS